MKIKITKKLLKEASKTPLDEATLPPRGKIKGSSPEDTEKFDNRYPEFNTKRVEIPITQELPSSSDPTAKESPEDIKRALSKVIKEPGLLEKVFGYIKSKFLSQPSVEAPEAEAEVEEPMRKFDSSKYTNPAEDFGIPKLGDAPESEVGLGDPMEDPDPYGRKSRLGESVDKDDKFRPLRELARRHFKKG
tara:strand:+ start:112 stop:681 length:570 start_codon:yes stop_codon:yes gene_type:complete